MTTAAQDATTATAVTGTTDYAAYRDALFAKWDAITADELRTQGSVKWTVHPDAIGMFIAEMDLGIAGEIRDAIAPSVERGSLGYLPPAENQATCESTARYQREQFGWDVTANEVYLLPDVISGLSACIEYLSAPGTPVVIFTPAYMPFLYWPRTHNREMIAIPCPQQNGRYVLDLDALDETLAKTGPGTLVVLCNPWNPAGRVLTREELLAFADVIEKHGARVFSDEIHATLVLDPDKRHIPYASLDARTAAHTATGVSATKGWNIPGLKCGQLILTNPADREIFARYTVRLEEAVALLGARATRAAYDDARAWNAAAVEYFRGNAKLLSDAIEQGRLPGVRMNRIEGTYIAWLDFRGTHFGDNPLGKLDDDIREACGVALTDGAEAGEPGYARMVLATPRPILQEAIDRLSAALS